MNNLTIKSVLLILTIVVASSVGRSSLANGVPWVECNPKTHQAPMRCGDMVEIEDCTVKVNCDAFEDETISGSVNISFGYTTDTLDSCYTAEYAFAEGKTVVCSGISSVNIDDLPESKVVCENANEFAFKVKCLRVED